MVVCSLTIEQRHGDTACRIPYTRAHSAHRPFGDSDGTCDHAKRRTVCFTNGFLMKLRGVASDEKVIFTNPYRVPTFLIVLGDSEVPRWRPKRRIVCFTNDFDDF